jgi:hypothetical protein
VPDILFVLAAADAFGDGEGEPASRGTERSGKIRAYRGVDSPRRSGPPYRSAVQERVRNRAIDLALIIEKLQAAGCESLMRGIKGKVQEIVTIELTGAAMRGTRCCNTGYHIFLRLSFERSPLQKLQNRIRPTVRALFGSIRGRNSFCDLASSA